MATSTSHPIIDSHIHLYPASELSTLAWCTPNHPLGRQCSVSDFRKTSSDQTQGFVFLETDRKNNNSTSWTDPLAEISWLGRIVEDKPREGEGHSPGDSKLCLGIVPWAPMNLGKEKVEEWLERARETAGEETWKRVKGFRYLLQDKEDGTAVTEDFVGGLKVLGRKGFVFDVGVDQHRRGRKQLEEAVEMVERAHDGVKEGEKVVFILSEYSPSQGMTYAVGLLNISNRPSLQTGLDHRQHHHGPLLYRLANGHVHAQQVRNSLHEAQRLLCGNAGAFGTAG